jgi:YD repeat-containing protein
VNYTYDGNGNQTAAGTRTFAFDLANRVKSTTSGATTITYSYDGDGTRLQEQSGATVTKLLWDVNNHSG